VTGIPSSNLPRYSAVALVMLLLVCNADAQTYETPRAFKASQVLPTDLRKGEYFSVAETVRSDGYLYLFDVQSSFGPYQANGRSALQKLAYEIAVIGELSRFTSSKVFAEAAKRGGVSIVTAPVKVIRNVADAATNPDETRQAVQKAPQGTANLFGWAANKSKSGVKEVGETVSNDKKAEDKEGRDFTKTAMSSTKNAALGFIGDNEKANKWYDKYLLDPYTTNKPLRDKISEIARVETAVKVGFRFVPGIQILRMIADANRIVVKAKQLSLYADPKTLADKNKLALTSLGVPDELSSRFMQNKAYTPTTRTFLLDGIERLNNVENRQELVEIASTAQTSEETVFFAWAIQHLAETHEKTPTLKSVVRGSSIPAAMSHNGKLLLPLPLDYVIWSKEVADVLNSTIKSAQNQEKVNAIQLIVSGSVSQRFDSEAQALGCQLQTNVKMEGLL
jgi:hypothetical protein